MNRPYRRLIRLPPARWEMVLNPVFFCGVQWAKLGQKRLRVAFPPPLPFVLTRDGCKDTSLTPSKKGTPGSPVPLLFLAHPESSLLCTCIPADLTAVEFRTLRLATPGSAVCVHRSAFLCPAAQRGHRALRGVG